MNISSILLSFLFNYSKINLLYVFLSWTVYSLIDLISNTLPTESLNKEHVQKTQAINIICESLENGNSAKVAITLI